MTKNNSSQILTFSLNNATINALETVLKNCLKNPKSIIDKKKLRGGISTVDGAQTHNVINLIQSSFFSELNPHIDHFINQFYGKRVSRYKYFIDYIHFISYSKGGYQTGHTHHSHEDISFIVYLNDSNAITRIYQKNGYKEIKSVKGKLVIFDASLYHEATKCNDIRNIAVGSIKFSDKIWIDKRRLVNESFNRKISKEG